MRCVAVTGLWLACSAATLAEPVKLTGAAIEEAVSGAVIAIDTPLGSKVPVRYFADGRVTGEAGDVAFYLGAPQDEGRWWVANYKLCHKWTRWFEGKDMCLVLKRDGDVIHWRDADGDTGTATIVEKAQASVKVAAAAPAPALPPPREKAVAATASLLPFTEVASLDAVPIAAVEVQPKASAAAPVIATPKRDPAKAIKAPVAASSKPGKTKSGAAPAKPAGIKNAAAATPAKASVPPPRPQQPTFRVTMVAPGDVLWIRQGPSRYHVPVGSIPHTGHGVSITGTCRGEWCPVKFGSYAGWANHWYLEPNPPHMARNDR